jgi:FkbM family methyltransferase
MDLPASSLDDNLDASLFTLRSNWQPAIALLPSLLRRPILRLWPHQSIGIGRHTLDLDTSQRHEQRYFEAAARREKTIDILVGERFIRRGDAVLDAGANIGFTSLAYLALGAREVHAVEPVSALYTRLSKVHDRRLTAHQVCLSDRNGSQRIFLSAAHNQGHSVNDQMISLFPTVFGPSPATEIVKVARADDLFRSTFDFMKIDVEGSEAALLDGARGLLARGLPRAVQIEIYPDYFDAVHGRLVKYFNIAYRAFIERGRLGLGEIATRPKGPPVFVYTNEAKGGCA